ncbi:hypothetical protein Pelo_13825 [Pelomyxa schiedti]|nr:hypothetical protein Pelo_13825 [Pelomyxa schiedti]
MSIYGMKMKSPSIRYKKGESGFDDGGRAEAPGLHLGSWPTAEGTPDSTTVLTIPCTASELTFVDQVVPAFVDAKGIFALTVPDASNTISVQSLSDTGAVLLSLSAPKPMADRAAIIKSQIDREVNYQTDSDLKDNTWHHGILLNTSGATVVSQLPASPTPVVTLTKEHITNIRLCDKTPQHSVSTSPCIIGTLGTKNVSQNHKIALKYTTPGLFWTTEYMGVLNADETQLVLTGSYLISNTTGCSYPQAKLALSKISPTWVEYEEDYDSGSTSVSVSFFSSSSSRQKSRTHKGQSEMFFLNRLVDIPEKNQVLRVPFLDASVPVRMVTVISPEGCSFGFASDENVFKYSKYPDIDKSSSVHLYEQVKAVMEFEYCNNRYGDTVLPKGVILPIEKWSDDGVGVENFCASSTFPQVIPGALVRIPVQTINWIQVQIKKIENTLNKRDHIFSEVIQVTVTDKRTEGDEIALRFEQPQARWKDWEITQSILDNSPVPHAKLGPAGKPSTHALFQINSLPQSKHVLIYVVEYTKWISREEAQEAKRLADEQAAQAVSATAPPALPPREQASRGKSSKWF